MLMAVVSFTFFPPQTELFRDVVTSTFGIPDKNMDMGAFALEKLKNVPMDKIIKIRENLLQAEYRVKTGEIAFYELPVELALLS